MVILGIGRVRRVRNKIEISKEKENNKIPHHEAYSHRQRLAASPQRKNVKYTNNADWVTENIDTSTDKITNYQPLYTNSECSLTPKRVQLTMR